VCQEIRVANMRSSCHCCAHVCEVCNGLAAVHNVPRLSRLDVDPVVYFSNFLKVTFLTSILCLIIITDFILRRR
jgi:hypothetical protein